MQLTEKELQDHILATLARLPNGKSLSPQEIAQQLPVPDWRPYLSKIKQAGLKLGETETITYLRKGKPITPAQAKGVIRWRLPGVPNSD